MSGEKQQLKPSTRWSDYGRGTWGPYWDAMFGSQMVTGWVNWKRGSTGVNVARLYWYQREYLRLACESVYGSDPAAWPSQHPGVVLGDRAACLRCHYFGSHSGPLPALDLARRHETSGGEFRDRGNQRPHPGPEPSSTPTKPRRTPVPALRITERYAGGRRRRPD
ncbi:MAG: hypothetical protein ABI253_03900 [Mycobacterium sp.]